MAQAVSAQALLDQANPLCLSRNCASASPPASPPAPSCLSLSLSRDGLWDRSPRSLVELRERPATSEQVFWTAWRRTIPTYHHLRADLLIHGVAAQHRSLLAHTKPSSGASPGFCFPPLALARSRKRSGPARSSMPASWSLAFPPRLARLPHLPP